MSSGDELVKDFLVESFDNLDQMDQDFVSLEQNPDDAELISNIFRCIHTVKGTCGFFGFSQLESVSHAGENLLTKLRDQELRITPEITTALLQLVDAVRAILANIEETGADGVGDYSALVVDLTRLQEGAAAPAEPETSVEAPTEEAIAETVALESPAAAPAESEASVEAPAEEAGNEAPAPEEKKEPQVGTVGEILVQQGDTTPEAVQEALIKQQTGDPRHVGEILVESGHVESKQVVEALEKQKETKESAAGGGSIADSTIRVDVSILDKLMNMVGELVLARNQTLQFNIDIEDPAFHSATQRLDLITTELQEGIMKTRMQPIGNVWNKFPRVVRDISVSLGKEVRIEMEGKDTELDKTILEAIKDPLTHIVRNAVDHGIEGPDDREQSGKAREGVLRLRAFHEGGQVNIEIQDDGAGINTDVLKAKAIERNVITVEEADNFTEREVLNLIFMAGFSTAKEVTNISGRGVGMDVVKTNVEKIGGTVDIQSTFGSGSTLRIKIPLTLAIIPALVVHSRNQRFAIPQVSLLELVRLDGEEAKKIEFIQDTPVYRLRGNLLPLVYLDKLLGMDKDDDESPELDSINIVVLQAEDRHFGIMVESIQDTEEIVVKPLGKQLKSIPAFAGVTIMGDGKVALILDVMGIAQSANVINESLERQAIGGHADSDKTNGEKQAMLLFQSCDGGHMAIPLSDVARLEEFEAERIETVGEHAVVQYRDQIMALVDVGTFFGDDHRAVGGEESDVEADSDMVRVVVYGDTGRYIGLLVRRVEDITEQVLNIKGDASREGVLFTAVIDDRVREFLDVESILRAMVPSYFTEVA